MENQNAQAQVQAIHNGYVGTVPTIGEALDQKIRKLNDEIARLQKIKEDLAKPESILNMTLNDLYPLIS